MTETIEKMTKAELLAAIDAERRHFETVLARVGENRIAEPGVQEAWSVKDILAHIAAWEKRMIRWVGEALRGAVPEMPGPGLTWDDVDRLNAETYQRDRNRALDDVLADFHFATEEAIRTVEAAPEEDLIEPTRFAWRKGSPLWKMVAANTWWHYREHGEAIEAWLKGAQKSREPGEA